MSSKNDTREGRVSSFCRYVVLRLYELTESQQLRSNLRRLVLRMEGGPAYSLTIRAIFQRFYGVHVGLYTAGPCGGRPKCFHSGTTIGRYSSIAETVRTFTRHHPMNTLSSHAVFYNPALGVAKVPPLNFGKLLIGHGVSIGHNAIILAPTEQIGNAAIITAGSVVYNNVPPYAIVAGFPARVTGYRFSKEVIAELQISKWWERTPAELLACRGDFHGGFPGATLLHCSGPTRFPSDLNNK